MDDEMIELIRAMFAAPEARSDPYVWSAALMGHWAIGAGLTALITAVRARHIWSAAIMTSIACLVGWEGGQLIAAIHDLSVAVTLPLLWDCVLDWTAVTLGAVTAAAVWQHRRRIVGTAVLAIIAIQAAGVRRRK